MKDFCQKLPNFCPAQQTMKMCVDKNETEPLVLGKSDEEVKANGSNWRQNLQSCRFVLALMGFSGIFMLFAMRVNLSVAIVDMVQVNHGLKVNSSNGNCPLRSPTSHDLTADDDKEKFDWSSSQQGNVLGSFFYGLVAGQIPAGILMANFKMAKLVFGLSVFLNALGSLATPLLASWGPYWLLCLRVFMGVSQGVAFPALNDLMGRWVPKLERSLFSSFVMSGNCVGCIVAQMAVGFLCTLPFLDGWPLGFYLTGLLACVWCLFWCFLVHDSPEEHPRISDEEVKYINANTIKKNKSQKIPWLSILTSGSVWAMILAMTGANWIGSLIRTCMPQFFAYVLNLDMAANGFLSGLPWIFCCFFSQVFATVTDYLRSKYPNSTTLLRKINQCVGGIGCSFFLVLTGYVGCNTTLATFCIIISLSLYAANYSANNCNNLDLAPSYAGLIFGISSTVSSISGFVVPVVVEQIIADDVHSPELWSHVFILSACIGTVGSLAFVVLGSGEIQPWAIDKNDDVDEDDKLLFKP